MRIYLRADEEHVSTLLDLQLSVAIMSVMTIYFVTPGFVLLNDLIAYCCSLVLLLNVWLS